MPDSTGLPTTSLPDISNRVKAAITDSVVLILMMYAFSILFSQFEEVPNNLRIASFVFVFLLYDPILTTAMGGTLGHRLMGLKVKKRSNTTENLPFFLSLPRFLVKVTLGWVSLLTVSSHKERLAIHDLAVGSIVLFRADPE